MSRLDDALIAAEAAFRFHEKGNNLQATLIHIRELFGNDPEGSIWTGDPFTEQDRKTIFECLREDVRESLDEYTLDIADELSYVECVALLDDDQDVTVECLQAIVDGFTLIEDYESGEHKEHEIAAAFMRRLKLVNDNGSLTHMGHAYIKHVRGE